MVRILVATLAVLSLLTGQATASEWYQYLPDDEDDPSYGHWYRLTSNNVTWEEANAEATAAGVFLVAIGSDDENTWVLETFGTAGGAATLGSGGNNGQPDSRRYYHLAWLSRVSCLLPAAPKRGGYALRCLASLASRVSG